MRRIALALLASTSLLGLASVAEAADLAVRKAPPPPPPPPLWSWTGFYIGAHVGAGWARNEFTTKNEFCLGDEFDGFNCENRDRGSHNAIGGLGGVQVGFNWQAGWVLFGIEGQYSWADLKGDHADSTHLAFGELDGTSFILINAQSRFSTKIKGIGTIAARLGIVSGPQDRTLFYVKGGAAYVKADFKERINGSFLGAFDLDDEEGGFGPIIPLNVNADFSGSRSKWGWMFGAGVEWGLWDNWSAKIEYNYLDFGNKDVKSTGTVCVSGNDEGFVSECFSADRNHSIDQTIQVIKFGLNYRFGWFGKAPAVMAKY
jgi:outer membrane immunogenic protein